ncbi:LysR family transcriptional regulator [Pandoraea sputorum]|uniref:Morphology and auto-aggregation control protein n=1 Tax=Pandoraea sputorum TaxID=93222 RepID=A0A239SE88_9BURK|nr:LysR family transcriptional regulator [Pandoraea sputorum]AJC16639.1 LysR family transcriptional regulator [Pandoraea sputorum]SNU83746.1 Morphology and auto-aggregation control protein [Pandoraea sputorum]VVD95567.1 LysR family transcriptional regulator [Pandoraea sputorum]
MIRYLKTFVTAAETASFSAAGARLGLTQSAVSAQIQRLEDDLGVQLFERTGRAVSLSDDGRRLLSQAQGVIAGYQSMRGEAGAFGGQAALAPINVGAILTVQLGLLPGAVQRWTALGAMPHLNIVPGMSVQLLAQLDARELDLAVMIRPRIGVPVDMKWLTLMHEPYVAIAPKGAKGGTKSTGGTVADWSATLPFVRYNRRSYGGDLVERYLRRHRLWVREGVELDEPEVILRMVRAGLGWSIVPATLIGLPVDVDMTRTSPKQGKSGGAGVQVLPLSGAPLTRELGVLARQSALKRAPVNALMKCLSEEAASRG